MGNEHLGGGARGGGSWLLMTCLQYIPSHLSEAPAAGAGACACIRQRAERGPVCKHWEGGDGGEDKLREGQPGAMCVCVSSVPELDSLIQFDYSSPAGQLQAASVILRSVL